MKASELRIGNLLEFSNGIQPTKIVTVGRRFFSSAAIEKEDGDFEITPYYKEILLTEDWLLKLGFKRNDNTKVSDSFYWIMVGGSEFNINPDNGVVWINRGENIFNNPCLIEYVHQLQNIYYALTGVELSVS